MSCLVYLAWPICSMWPLFPGTSGRGTPKPPPKSSLWLGILLQRSLLHLIYNPKKVYGGSLGKMVLSDLLWRVPPRECARNSRVCIKGRKATFVRLGLRWWIGFCPFCSDTSHIANANETHFLLPIWKINIFVAQVSVHELVSGLTGLIFQTQNTFWTP